MKPLSGLFRAAAVLLVGLTLLAGCGGGGGDSASVVTADTGIMSLAITDQPACGYDNVFITVEKVRVHQSGSAGDADSGWHEIVLNPARRIDLLDLTNGVLEELGQTALPAGTYTQMRLVLVSNDTTPKANSVVLTGSGNEEELKTPSGQQSGLKMNVNLTVQPGKVVDFVLDFDACKSVVKAGNSGTYLLKPVVSVIPVLSKAGQRIIGYLDTLTVTPYVNTYPPVARPLVSAQQNGIVVKATIPDASGKFVLYPVPPGTYNLVITLPGRATAVMTGVPVVNSAYTYVGSETVRIALVESLTRDALGTVFVNGSPLDTDATVRAMQTLHNGPTVEVASKPVDADMDDIGCYYNCNYSLTLAIGSPQVVAYVANPVSIDFVPDSTDAGKTAAGKYTLEASIAGLPTLTQTELIDVSNDDVKTDFFFTH